MSSADDAAVAGFLAVGGGDERADQMAPEAASRLASAIGDARRFGGGDPLPLLWHWCYFPELVAPRDVGPDGHPHRTDELRERYPRRMAGGSRVEELAPLRVGAPATRRTDLGDVALREGRSGRLAIVQYVHTYAQGGRDVRRETQTVIYRGPASGASTAGGPSGATGRPGGAAGADQHPAVPPATGRTLTFDPVLLFRFSAVTWNGHRIHYDRDYATKVEGYPGLVVHGPLLAVLLLRELEAVAGPFARVAHRAEAPVFDADAVRVELGQGDGRWQARAVLPDGRVATSLDAETGAGT